MANASKIATLLREAGLNVLKVTQGCEYEDGEVQVTEFVSVQVPTFGSACCVVREADKGTPEHGFFFGPCRRSHQALFEDVREAMRKAGEVQS